MARYKPYSYAQTKLIPINYRSQIQPGTFEFVINHIVESMALSTDAHPNFTTIADFISSMSDEITPLRNILMICSKEGLIGKNMIAVDGCKISSNCSEE